MKLFMLFLRTDFPIAFCLPSNEILKMDHHQHELRFLSSCLGVVGPHFHSVASAMDLMKHNDEVYEVMMRPSHSNPGD